MYSEFWFDMNISVWEKLFQKVKGLPNLHFLEIGCFEGRATTWLLKNVLTDPSSKITVIDTFEGSWEHQEMGKNIENLEKNFLENIKEYKDKVNVYKAKSQDILFTFLPEQFDFIYIDGSHDAADVLRDGVFAWDLIKKEGVIVFDDYTWGKGLPQETRPHAAINGCLNTWGNLCKYTIENDQVIVYKK